jgi:ATP-dependent protease ClpP protease subunit
MAASAATFMSVVGSKRFITPHSYALIHQLSSEAWGQYNKIKEEVRNLDQFMEDIKRIYLKYTDIPSGNIDEILGKDLYFSPQRCLELGIVDYIK